MNSILFSILLVIIGLFVGGIAVIFVNYLRGVSASGKAEEVLKQAKQEAEAVLRIRRWEIPTHRLYYSHGGQKSQQGGQRWKSR